MVTQTQVGPSRTRKKWTVWRYLEGSTKRPSTSLDTETQGEGTRPQTDPPILPPHTHPCPSHPHQKPGSHSLYSPLVRLYWPQPIPCRLRANLVTRLLPRPAGPSRPWNSCPFQPPQQPGLLQAGLPHSPQYKDTGSGHTGLSACPAPQPQQKEP